MKKNLKKRITLFKFLPRYIQKTFQFSWGFNILILVMALLVYPRLQPVIPIFYSLASPSQQLAVKSWIFIYPALSFLFNLLHLIIIRLILHLEKTMIQLFAISTLVLQVLILLIIIRTIYIII